MKQLLLPVVVLIFIYGPVDSAAQCSNGRYYDKIFNPETSTGVLFGNAIKFDGTAQDLKMDIYQPEGDNFARRPLIVLAFGGSFTAGLRQSPDILKLCDEFSRRGYVCATIDYRLGFEDGNDSDTNQFKALMRGVQDMRAAVRFFYKDAQTLNLYRIDTSQIFIGGVSAGGVIALNYGYGKEDTLSRARPVWADDALAEVGGGIGNSGNPGYSDKVKGVINLCGAIADTVWLMPGDPILVAVHGSNDGLVPCRFDSAQAQNSVEAMLFGSCDLEVRATNIGLPHSIKILEGADHVPFILYFFSPGKEYMDTTIWTIRDFLYPNVVCDSSVALKVSEPVLNDAIVVFPVPSSEAVTIQSKWTEDLRVGFYTSEGKLLQVLNLKAGGELRLEKNEWSAGSYLLSFSNDARQTLGFKRLVFY